MVGEELWRHVKDYAEMAANFFFRGRRADAEDHVQDAAVLCLGLPEKYPGKPMEELVLIAKRSVWMLCLAGVSRKKRPIPFSSMNNRERRGADERHLEEMQKLATVRPNERAVEAADIMGHIEARLLERDKPIMKMRAEGLSRAEMMVRTGRSLRCVALSLERIHEVARRYDS